MSCEILSQHSSASASSARSGYSSIPTTPTLSPPLSPTSTNLCEDRQNMLDRIMRQAPGDFLKYIKSSSVDLHALTLNRALLRVSSTTNSLEQEYMKNISSCSHTAQLLQLAADGAIYFVEDRPYILNKLLKEFPEFSVFQLKLGNTFTESETCPNIWIENSHFMNLRSLAPLRRELQNVHITEKDNMVALICSLLIV